MPLTLRLARVEAPRPVTAHGIEHSLAVRTFAATMLDINSGCSSLGRRH